MRPLVCQHSLTVRAEPDVFAYVHTRPQHPKGKGRFILDVKDTNSAHARLEQTSHPPPSREFLRHADNPREQQAPEGEKKKVRQRPRRTKTVPW